MIKHLDTSKDFFTRYALAVVSLEKDKADAETAIKAIDTLDKLYSHYQEDCSLRNMLSIARASVIEIVRRNSECQCSDGPFHYESCAFHVPGNSFAALGLAMTPVRK